MTNMTSKGRSITKEPIARIKPMTKTRNEFRKASKSIRLSSSSANAGSFSPVVIRKMMLKIMLITMCAAIETSVRIRTKEPQ
ncbi:hypothetical protein D3C87_1797120 [compost metagenome]